MRRGPADPRFTAIGHAGTAPLRSHPPGPMRRRPPERRRLSDSHPRKPVLDLTKTGRVSRAIGSTSMIVTITSALLAGCAASNPPAYNPQATARQLQDAVAAGLPSPTITQLGALPHPTDAWTEGLEISDGRLYEGTGRAGHSQLRELDPDTGRPLRTAPLPDGLDGAGITVTGSLIWQLTQHNGIALEWDRDRLTPGGRVPWRGTGAGLCHTPNGRLVASDGTDELRVIDHNGTQQIDTIAVSVQGFPLQGLKALSCAPTAIWANVADTNWIVAIDPDNGNVTAAVDVSALVPAAVAGNPSAVPNGIAEIPPAGTFLITGRLWPWIYRVRFGAPRGSSH